MTYYLWRSAWKASLLGARPKYLVISAAVIFNRKVLCISTLIPGCSLNCAGPSRFAVSEKSTLERCSARRMMVTSRGGLWVFCFFSHQLWENPCRGMLIQRDASRWKQGKSWSVSMLGDGTGPACDENGGKVCVCVCVCVCLCVKQDMHIYYSYAHMQCVCI